MSFSKSFATLMIALLGYASTNAYSQDNTVTITGDRPTCTGDCSTPLISGSSGGSTGSGQDGWSSHDPNGNNDGTTGKSTDFNRFQPGCQREGLFYAEAMAGALAGTPPGQIIMDSFGDPLYQDPGWVKIQFDRFYSDWKIGWPATIEYRTQLHYMYNLNTGQVAQMKFKTSYEYGCKGFAKP